jgi:hypothetical protein
MRKLLAIAALAAALPCAGAAAAAASDYNTTAPVLATGASPFPPGCGGPGEADGGTNFQNAEVEPWLDVDPGNPNHLAASWQQDRWSNGGAHGLLWGITRDGGTTWSYSAPRFTRCAGAVPGDPGYFQRASDPWHSFAPNGDLHAISLSFDGNTTRNAVLASKSTDGGDTWGPVKTLRFDSSEKTGIPNGGNNFNDKESITADWTPAAQSRYVYAIWDRLVSPSENAPEQAFLRSVSFHGPTWFARSTNGGQSWETAHPIFDPKALNQTIANQIVVHPSGTLVDGFLLLQGAKNNQGRRGATVAVIRSPDRGVTWSSKPIAVSPQGAVGNTDPEPRPCPGHLSSPCTLVRTGDLIVDLAVDKSNGNLYMVWQDHRSSPFGDDTILFSRSTNAGLSWSAPIKVNKTPSGAYNTQAFTAGVDVAPNGDVAVTYYDMRNDVPSDAQLSTDHWLVHSHNGGVSFDASEERLSGPAPFDMRTAPYARGYFLGDYEGLSHSGNLFDAFFIKANDGNAANQTDGFFTKSG